jgi:short-subunit dehydrogenase
VPLAPFPLRGAVAVITGAASGIGRALALDLASHGCALALVDRNEAGLASVAALLHDRGATVSTHILDIADAAGIAALPDAVLAVHSRVSLLLNNAGVALMGNFAQTAPEDVAWLFDINFWGVVRMTRAFLPALQCEKTAQIVTLSSVFGLIGPAGHAAYAASKFAVRGFSEALRHELETTGIGVSVVHPGGVATAIARDARISPGIAPADAARDVALFAQALVTLPEVAAARIVAGIQRREKRILVGRDARIVDIIQRIAPTGYWGVLQRIFGWPKLTNSTLAPEQSHG